MLTGLVHDLLNCWCTTKLVSVKVVFHIQVSVFSLDFRVIALWVAAGDGTK